MKVIIEGSVIDADAKTPLAGITVKVFVGRSARVSATSITNNLGIFTVPVDAVEARIFSSAAVKFALFLLYLTFFTNVVLLAAFLGMSVGCLAASHPRSYLRWTALLLVVGQLAALAVDIGSGSFIKFVDVGNQPSPEQIYFGTEYSGLLPIGHEFARRLLAQAAQPIYAKMMDQSGVGWRAAIACSKAVLVNRAASLASVPSRAGF